MPDIAIRPYRPADRGSVESVMRRALDRANAYFPDLEDEDGDPSLRPAYYEAPGGALLVAEDAERIVGTVGMRTPSGDIAARHGPFGDSVGELKRMHVRPAWQRCGVGRRLLEAISARARGVGYENFVFTTTSRQTAAQRFYETYGFEQFGRESIPTQPIDLLFYRGPVRSGLD